MAYTTINKPSLYFNSVLYTGNGATQSITSVGFQPDLTWLKGRSFSPSIPALIDSVRGRSKDLYSDRTSAEETSGPTEDLTSFDTNGFSLGTSARFQSNNSGQTFVSWNWLANNTSGSSNTAGSITSTVAANTTSGFSIVSYTGTGANATVGHGLGVAPAMIICKSRTQAQNWAVYHSSLGNTKAIFLDGTGAPATSSSYWNNTSPTSTVFTVGNSGDVNYNAGTQISYCFAEVKGYSKFGGYTGNGNADGTFVYTGFKPAFILLKDTTSATSQSWPTFDNKRNTYNPESLYLYVNTSGSEGTETGGIDFLSNGFKLRNNFNYTNYSGNTYIYMAFAENPFVSSTLIPTTAR